MAFKEIDCLQNHVVPPDEIVLPLPNGNRIGKRAGWSCYALFVKQFGDVTDQYILNQIAAINTDYQQNEYLPRHTEAAGLLAFFGVYHECYEPCDEPFECPGCGLTHTPTELEILKQAKFERLCEIDAEIEQEWLARCAAIRALIGEDAYNTFWQWGKDNGY